MSRLRRYGWLAVGLALFGLLAANISWFDTWATLKQLTFGAIALLTVANLAALLPMFSRWWVVLKGQNASIPFWDVARYSLGGFAISYITPGPQFGGEPYQVIQLNRQHHISIPQASASVTIEKMLMLVTNLLFLIPGIILLLQSQLFAAADLLTGLIPGLVAAGLLLVLLVGWVYDCRPMSRLAQLLPHKWGGSIEQTESEIVLFCSQKPAQLFWAGLMSALNWLLLAAEYFMMARFLGIPISPVQGLIMLTVFRLALLLPIPAGIGAVEGGHIWILETMGVGAELALSLSLLIRLRDILIAGFGLWLVGGRLTDYWVRKPQSKSG